MGDRRLAREHALHALFYFDVTDGDVCEMTDLYIRNFGEMLNTGITPFFMDLVEGVMGSRGRIDALLNKYSKNWRLSRMPVVDRNIMRIAVFELTNRSDIPASVSINEAVEIGKKYGTRGSASFINGVLDRVRISEDLK